ncbi:desmocollin 2-like protein [Odontesthes bonariensis]|uniref:desmocollin 2-like protein n=1 Tax=Odontesthes bonariensis TaxID=219752 RepID=UPI003F58735E
MANVLFFAICSVLTISRVDSCYIPHSLYVLVPQSIPVGYQIAKVEAADCDTKSLRLTLKDPTFAVESNGAIVTLTPVSVAVRGRTFSVTAQDNNGQESEMEVHLVRNTMQETDHKGLLKRSKRRWSPPPFNILENEKGPFPRYIDTVVSDAASKLKVFYTISGPAVDQLQLFRMESDTGKLSVLKAVDREQYPSFILKVSVFDANSGQMADLPLNLEVIVDDENDNAPEFTDQLQFTVAEQCSIGTVVGKVIATDRDDPKTTHVQIKYTLVDGLERFAIHPETGVITTVINTLDREVKDTHMVTVMIKDLNGAVNGLYNTATATITLSDINDNPPTFTKTSYEASIKENESEMLILRIPVEDKDLINTPNWKSQFVIKTGNEKGNFRIDTDNRTNEGLLYVVKPLDYEQNEKVKLEILARNEAELTGTTAQWMSIPVDVTVTNVDEGPQFSAPTVRIGVKENVPNGTLIGSYTAVDPETKSSNGIKYYKIQDPGSWISVDRNTGELRVANTIDRESHLVTDGIYNVTMKAVDTSGKTGTGTVILVIEDLNDNKPTIPSELVLCEDNAKQLGSLVVVAEDNDSSPYSYPFTFSMPPDHDGQWSVKQLNDTAATLHQVKELRRGIHKVPLIVRDMQGNGETQTATVRICKCKNGVCLADQKSVELGPMGILALLLPLALLLLLGLLLAFFCMTKPDTLEIDEMGYGGGVLLPSNTEGPGDEVDVNLVKIPIVGTEQAIKGPVKGSLVNVGWPGNQSSSTFGGHSVHENGIYQHGISTTNMQEFSSGQYEHQQLNHLGGSQLQGMGLDHKYLTQNSTNHHTWQTNSIYLKQKLKSLQTEGDGRYADDIIHSYGYEGVGSVAGSVGCCSDHGDNDNLDFLNTLDPKFKSLAAVCRKS